MFLSSTFCKYLSVSKNPSSRKLIKSSTELIELRRVSGMGTGYGIAILITL